MIDNLDLMKKRLEYYGSSTNFKKRMEGHKINSLEYGFENSYNSATVELEGRIFPALIEEKRLTETLNNKTISCLKNNGVEEGKVITWQETDTKWIVYSHNLNETAYFSGNIRRCEDQPLKIGEVDYYFALVGPSEKDIDNEEFNSGVIDVPNQTIDFIISADTKIDRYFKFKYADKTWQVQAVNTVDYRNIIRVYAEENYEIIEDKPDLDDVVVENWLSGPAVIKPLSEHTYRIEDNNLIGSWSVTGANIQIISQSDREITVKWNSTKSGYFTIAYGEESQMILVESLFN